MCVSLGLICNQMVRQMQAYHAKDLQAQQFQTEELRRQLDDKTTRQAERQSVEQAREKSLKDLAQGFAGLIAGPSQDLVWCPKYRWPVLTEAVVERLKALLQEKADEFSLTIHTMEITPDHVHLL
jgi:Transposase IS200 like